MTEELRKMTFGPRSNDNNYLDVVIPFLLNETDMRGKMVRLGLSLDEILAKHSYPASINNMLAEMLVIVSMLGDSLKNDGMVTAQIQADGPIKVLIADYFENGKIRGYASFDAEKLDNAHPGMDFSELLPNGFMAVTIDGGEEIGRYQGVVELKGNSLSHALEEYFSKSEQIKSCFKIEVNTTYGSGIEFRTAGGIMIQCLPNGQYSENTWEEVKIFVETISKLELTTPSLSPAELLHRLFHERGVWVYDAKMLEHGCKCTRERAENALRHLSETELEEMKEEGAIEVKCEFCGKVELF